MWREIPSLECEEWRTAKYLFPKTGRILVLKRWKASNKGRLRNKNKLLSDNTTLKGYIWNCYKRKETKLKVYRHRIVLSTFVENPDWRVYKEGDHIDNNNKQDNSLDNLRWSTGKMNRANKKMKARPRGRKKFTFRNYNTDKYPSFDTKEECEAAIKVYQHKSWKKASAEAILDCIILDCLASRTI